eukprot:419178_1
MAEAGAFLGQGEGGTLLLELTEGSVGQQLLQGGDGRVHVAAGVVHLDDHLEAGAELSLEVLQGTNAAQGALGHDGHTVGQYLHLLQVVGGQDDGAVLGGAADHTPQLAAAGRVHPGGGLVQEEHLGGANQGQGDAELALVATGQLVGGHGLVVGQAADLEQVGNDGGDMLSRHAAEGSVELEVLLGGHEVDEGVELRAVANLLAGGGGIGDNIVTSDQTVAVGGQLLAGEDRHGGGLAGAVGAQEGEDLGGLHAKGHVADRLLAVGVLLAQVAHADEVFGAGVGLDGGALGSHILVLVLDGGRDGVGVVEQLLPPALAAGVVHHQRGAEVGDDLEAHEEQGPAGHVHVEGVLVLAQGGIPRHGGQVDDRLSQAEGRGQTEEEL